MIRSAAGEGEPNGAAAPGLTQSYMRIRGEVAELVADTPLAGEFFRSFPEVEVMEVYDQPGEGKRLEIDAGHIALRAQGLLRQLAWSLSKRFRNACVWKPLSASS